MLIPRKLEKKRIIAYFVIIGVMIGATAYLILANMNMGNNNGENIDASTQEMMRLGLQGAKPADDMVLPQVTSVSIRKDSPLKILDDPRFTILEENEFSVIEKSEVKMENVGRENPFEIRQTDKEEKQEGQQEAKQE